MIGRNRCVHKGRAGWLAHQLSLLLQNAAQVAVNGRKLRHEAYRCHVAVDGLLDQTLRKMTPMGREISRFFITWFYDWSMERMTWCVLFSATTCLIGRGCPLRDPSLHPPTHTHPTVIRRRPYTTCLQPPPPTHPPTHPLTLSTFFCLDWVPGFKPTRTSPTAA